MSEPDPSIIQKLQDSLDKENGLADLLERSLTKARDWAKKDMDPELFSALEWPCRVDEYKDHRYHVPVAGVLKESFRINGKVFMHVGLEDGQLQGIDSAASGYEFSQTRGVVTIDTAQSECGDIGVVAVIPVGMGHVSSVVLTAVENQYMAKGEEFGYFQFGGSDIIILFQQGVDPQLDKSQEFRLVGTPIARCRPRSN